MGYTHYWVRPGIIETTAFNAIATDVSRLLPCLKVTGSPLANPHGREKPEIGPEFIGFNGVECCGHEKNPNVRLPWPKDDAHGIGSNHGIGGNLPYRTCNGDCSYESVWFERCPAKIDGLSEAGGLCKTNLRPYYLAVMAFLVIVKHHLGSAAVIQTDGNACYRADAFTLCQKMLGYGGSAAFQNGRLQLEQEALCG